MKRRNGTGTLELRKSGYWAKMPRDENGKREFVKLGTFDPEEGKRLLARATKGGRKRLTPDTAAVVLASPESFGERLVTYVQGRVDRGKIIMAAGEMSFVRNYLLPHDVYMRMPLFSVTPKNLRDLLKLVTGVTGTRTGRPLAVGTIAHVQRLLTRFFSEMTVEGVFAVSPMREVTLGKIKEHLPAVDKRPHAQLTDDEWQLYFDMPVDLATLTPKGRPHLMQIERFEMKMLAWTARCLGGARGAEVLRWVWEYIDLETGRCTLIRAKTHDVDTLDIPPALLLPLRQWHALCGSPTDGIVFPVTRGARKGEARGRPHLAARMRKHLWTAGVRRKALHEDIPAKSRRFDFHTIRREYVSDLSISGANEATVMALANHASSAQSRQYQEAQITAVPLNALPQVTPDFLGTRVTEAPESEAISTDLSIYNRFPNKSNNLSSFKSTCQDTSNPPPVFLGERQCTSPKRDQ